MLSFDTRANQLEVARDIRTSFQDFLDSGGVRLDEQLASLNDNSLVTDAVDRSSGLAQRNADRGRRTNSRVGFGATPAQRKAQERRAALGDARNSVGTINDSRIAQSDRNDRTRSNIANTAATLRGDGISNLLQVVGLGSARDRNNSQAQASANNANLGLATSLAVAAF